MWKPVLAISVGAALGALMRWQLGVRLNGVLPGMPPGTLAANVIGGFIIGLAIAYLAQSPTLSPEWRLFIITGFCGGLTTFSTFSAEVLALLQEGQMAWAMGTIGLHLCGSLLSTFAGLMLGQAFKTL